MKNAFQAFAVNTSDQKINTFVYSQWAQSGYQNSFKNYIQAEEECYKKFENQIKAAFNFEQRPLKNSPAITYLLTTRTPGPNQRNRNNGMAHLKINYKHLDEKGAYDEDTYYIRALFPKKGKLSFPKSNYYKNLTHFIAFIDDNTFAIIDNHFYYDIMKICTPDQYQRPNIDIISLLQKGYANIYNIDPMYVTNLLTGEKVNHLKYGNTLRNDAYLQNDGKQAATFLVMNEYNPEGYYLQMEQIAVLFGKDNKDSFRKHVYRYIANIKKSISNNIQIKPFAPRGYHEKWYILPLEYFRNYHDIKTYNKNAKERCLTYDEKAQKEIEHATIIKYRAWLKRHDGHINPKWTMDDISVIMSNKSLASLVSDEINYLDF